MASTKTPLTLIRSFLQRALTRILITWNSHFLAPLDEYTQIPYKTLDLLLLPIILMM